MNFRSSPPHRSSSGRKGGRSEFEKIQRQLQRTVERLGYDKLPLSDESLRPFLEILWRIGRARGLAVNTIDIEKYAGERLYYALLTDDAPKLMRIANEIKVELLVKYSLEEIKRAVPVILPSKTSVLYFEGVWTPVEALDGRHH